MLREIRNVQQRPDEANRRWFHSPVEDLYVWEKDGGEIFAFEYYYLESRKRQAVIWKPGPGLKYFSVDDGESSVFANRSPTLKQMTTLSPDTARKSFLAVSEDLPWKITKFVLEHLK
jgi:hypothetical protein